MWVSGAIDTRVVATNRTEAELTVEFTLRDDIGTILVDAEQMVLPANGTEVIALSDSLP